MAQSIDKENLDKQFLELWGTEINLTSFMITLLWSQSNLDRLRFIRPAPVPGKKCRVSELACFGAAPAPGILYPEPAPGKREHNVGIFEN